ncbi:S-layer homology domain-containing protein [Solibacillus sp. FSL W7-1436]|uniref:S-layer homology domain-containing protein n=1 Tax=Solibacillus sp. FSL W7-1436 TaxID=2921705 RepID=UPI0030FB83A0
MKKRITKSFIATTLFASALFVASDDVFAKKTFYDVENSRNSHTEAIQYLNNLNVYDYKSGNQFNFSKPVSRAEASKILQTILSSDSALAIPKERSYNGKFKDVTNSTPFAQEIIWAYESGIFDGDEYGNFNPDQPVKRSHLSKILVESLKLNGGTTISFKDVSKSSWYYDYVNILASYGITTGNENNQFLPNNNVTSAQMATFLYRALIYKTTGEVISEPAPPPVEKPDTATATYNSEYDFAWKQTGKNLDFELEGVDNNKIVARYMTKQEKSFFAAQDLKIGKNNASDVKAKYGTKNVNVRRGNVIYNTPSSNEYNFYLIDDYYVTFFYDIHKKNVIRSILYVHKDYEVNKDGYYGDISDTQKHSEQLMVELMNQARAAEGVDPLTHSPQWATIARKHSKDMIDNNYFSHTSLSGTTPYDRMISGGMSKSELRTWGENISYGHYNVIYAHEGFMNSKGHRDNLLQPAYKNAIVGLEYSSNKSPYFTINFY